MPDYSANAQTKINSTAADELPLMLLEINHDDLAQPIRVVDDNQDLIHNANTFVGMAFRVTPPDQSEQSMPRARIAVDNVGKEMVQWLETSNGGQGATVRMLQVLRSDPDTVEWEMTLDLTNLQMTMHEVSGQLGFDDLLNIPAVSVAYTPKTAPGLF